MCSFDSANGPSVVTTSPSCALHDGGDVGLGESAGEHPDPLGLHVGVECGNVGEHLLHDVLGRRFFAFDHVNGEQVLRHLGDSLLARIGSVPILSPLPRSSERQIDSDEENSPEFGPLDPHAVLRGQCLIMTCLTSV